MYSSSGDDKPDRLKFLTQSEITTYLPPSAKEFAECPRPEDKDVSKQYQSARLPSGLPALVFLGIDDRVESKQGAVPAEVDPKNPKGVAYFAVDMAGREDVEEGVEGGQWVEPRLAGSSLGGWEANVFAMGRALMGTFIPRLASILVLFGMLTSSIDTSSRLTPDPHTPLLDVLCG